MEKINISDLIEWVEGWKDATYTICDYFGYTQDEMVEFAVDKIDNFDKWKELYKEQTGTEPRQDFDVVAYFEELREVAESVIWSFQRKLMEQVSERIKRDPESFYERWVIVRG